MKKLVLALAILALGAGNLLAAQVDSDEYRKVDGRYNSSDGMYQRLDSEGLDVYIQSERQVSLGKGVYEDFSEYGDGDDWCYQLDGTVCSGTAGELDHIVFPSGNKLVCNPMGTQTILGALDMDAASLDISGDQTDNDGVECAWGTHGATGGAFTVGTDPAFFTCISMSIQETDGTDTFLFGFREAADHFNGDYTGYTDFAAFSIITAANPAALQLTTDLADAGEATTDTTITWDDEDRFDLCMFVGASGITTFYLNQAGTATTSFSGLVLPATTKTYTFADGVSVIPFFHMLQANGDQTDEVDVHEWLTGYGTWPLPAGGN